jgi:hypothetical protein
MHINNHAKNYKNWVKLIDYYFSMLEFKRRVAEEIRGEFLALQGVTVVEFTGK